MAASRPTIGASVFPALDRLRISGLDNWLLLANAACALVLLGSIAPPFLLEADLRWAADATHTLFLLLCPQRPEHSYFLFGHKLAMEQRMLAMFGAQLIGGLAFGALRGRVSSGLDWRLFTLASVPVAWDILSQSLGFRVSDWPTRTLTGVLFNLALVAWLYPLLNRALPLRGWRVTESRTR
jgi:uncharacterized membrane protein